MAPIIALSVELLGMIAEEVGNTEASIIPMNRLMLRDNLLPPASLRDLCCVSKKFHSIATPILHRTIILGRRLLPFLERNNAATGVMMSDIQAHTRDISIHQEVGHLGPQPVSWTWIADFLSGFKNLEDLK